VSRRLAPALAASLATAFFGAFTFGRGNLAVVFLIPAVALGVHALVLRRRPVTAGERWAVPIATAPAPTAPGSSRRVAAALARVESRELLLSGWFGVGLGMLAVILVTFAFVYPGDNGQPWREVAGLSPWFAHPLAGMTIVAVHRAVTRPVRDGTDELFESCPTDAGTRLLGMLRAAALPVVVFAGFVVLYGAVLQVRSPAVHGPIDLDAVPVVLAGPVLVAGAVALGAALGSWIRFGLVPIVAVVAVGMVSLTIATAGDPGWNGSSALSTFGPQTDSPLLLPLLAAWPNLLWLLALTVVVAVLAVLRHRRDRSVLLVGLGSAGVAVVALVLALAPVDAGDARHTADLIASPVAHQTCDAVAGVDVCTYEGFGELRRRVADEIAPVAAALPAGARSVSVRQGFDGAADDLPPEVLELLPGGVPPVPAGEVRIGYEAHRTVMDAFRLRLAFAALGLDLPKEELDRPMAVDGEARGVVALWLAARGLDQDDAIDLTTVELSDDTSPEDAFEAGLAWPEMCGPVVWSPQDLEAARALLRLDAAAVGAVVDAGFDRWSDRRTGTDELLAELGLPSMGPYSEIVPRTEQFC
jgi:hypothetical protein